MNSPGRHCPLHYRYSEEAFAGPALLETETLYVVGGLYGNAYALDAILELAAGEKQPPAMVFNGDFHWFDNDPALFAAINARVLAHTALRGNVETELGADGSAGCGCGYPEWVDDGEVERSNRIIAELQHTAATLPGAAARLAALPMHLVASVGGRRIAIVHGDGESLAGWNFSQENLISNLAEATRHLAAINADIVASSHTCLPVAQGFDTPAGARWLFNNGTAGMPNFSGDLRGLLTRISLTPSPGALYRARVEDVFVEAVPFACSGASWLIQFDHLWPADSPAALSYRRRMLHGPAYRVEQAARDGIERLSHA